MLRWCLRRARRADSRRPSVAQSAEQYLRDRPQGAQTANTALHHLHSISHPPCTDCPEIGHYDQRDGRVASALRRAHGRPGARKASRVFVYSKGEIVADAGRPGRLSGAAGAPHDSQRGIAEVGTAARSSDPRDWPVRSPVKSTLNRKKDAPSSAAPSTRHSVFSPRPRPRSAVLSCSDRAVHSPHPRRAAPPHAPVPAPRVIPTRLWRPDAHSALTFAALTAP